jgi:hypothetical protein
MKRLAKAIVAKAEGILRSIATGPFQRRPRSHQRQRTGRQAQGQRHRNKRNLKAIVYLIAGDVLAN